jgi:hypothetical protein
MNKELIKVLSNAKLSDRAKKFAIAMYVVIESQESLDSTTEQEVYSKVWQESITDAEVRIAIAELKNTELFNAIV